MSRRGRKRHRKKQTPRKAFAGRNLRAALEEVEFVAGHDGFLRGMPEPVIIFAAFGVSQEQTSLIGRALRRVLVREPYPSVTKITRVDERELFAVPVPDDYDRLLLLALAIEEDGGKDVSALYGTLAEPAALSSWMLGDLMPSPLSLGEAGQGTRSIPPEAHAVHLMRDGAYFSESCRSDDWVGAAAAILEVGQASHQQWRFHFVSEDKRNDWTGVFRIRL